MSTIHRFSGGIMMMTKGAVDVMLDRTSLSPAEREEIENANRFFSDQGLRVLAFGCRTLATTEVTLEDEKDFHFLGLIAMMDPPREESKQAVADCISAGIRPIMITGDHVITASAIAREIGILTPGTKAVEGAIVETMTDEELRAFVPEVSVYARVSPEHKIRIVRAWQDRGSLVAMTGDGVNDAPALKQADIGVAMGITGTEVAKDAAGMVLTDDNFATIVDAVREGRGIYANIRKVVGFLLGTNIGEVITVFVAMLLWHKTPLLSMQLLWINLVTDSLPAIALGMEAVEDDIMEQRPKPKNEGIFAHGLGLRTVIQGVMFGTLSLIAFWLGEKLTGVLEGGQTMAFMVLALSQVVQAFNMRSEHSLFKIGPFTNRKLNMAALASVLLVALVVFTPLRGAFGLIALPGKCYAIALGLILVPLLAMECSKAFGLTKHHR